MRHGRWLSVAQRQKVVQVLIYEGRVEPVIHFRGPGSTVLLPGRTHQGVCKVEHVHLKRVCLESRIKGTCDNCMVAMMNFYSYV